ncbi:glycosyltransferase [Mycolicibacterium chlorophenolicum]
MRSPAAAAAANQRPVVLVLGQYKPARDLNVMSAIAPQLRANGWQPVVAGRGWPEVPGWRVINRFLSRNEFTELLDASAVLLLPYQHYFQSGVALRALECGIPVVGRETGFLRSVLGPDFNGAVQRWDDPSSWAFAVDRATADAAGQIAAAQAYAFRATLDWRGLIERPLT